MGKKKGAEDQIPLTRDSAACHVSRATHQLLTRWPRRRSAAANVQVAALKASVQQRPPPGPPVESIHIYTHRSMAHSFQKRKRKRNKIPMGHGATCQPRAEAGLHVALIILYRPAARQLGPPGPVFSRNNARATRRDAPNLRRKQKRKRKCDHGMGMARNGTPGRFPCSRSRAATTGQATYRAAV